MKLSMRILESRISQTFSIVSFRNLNRGFCYEGASVYHAEIPLRAGTVYIVGLEEQFSLPRQETVCAFLFIGQIPRECCERSFEYLELSSEAALTEVINCVYGVFDLYWHWQEQMYQAIIDRRGLQQLFDVTLPIFINPVFYVDTTWTIRAYAEYPELMDIVQIYGSTDIQSSYAYDLKHSPQQLRSYQMIGPTLWEEDEYTPFPELYCNIFLEDVYVGRIFVDARVRSFTEGDYDTLEIFSEYVRKAVDNRNYSPMSYYRVFEQYLVALLKGDQIQTSQIHNELCCMGWEKYSQFFCMLIQLEERDNAAKSIVATCNTIEATLIHCRAFPYKDNIVILVPLEPWGNNQHGFTSKIAPIIRDGLFKASVSGMFSDIMQIPLYYQQAKIALEEGLKSASYQWIYRYEDFMLSHILHTATEHLPTKLLCPPGLLRLIEYDHKNGTEYVKTLRTYLDSNCSPTETIGKLYLARSTFLRRLERIEKILGMDLAQPDVRLYLMIVLRLVDTLSIAQ